MHSGSPDRVMALSVLMDETGILEGGMLPSGGLLEAMHELCMSSASSSMQVLKGACSMLQMPCPADAY
jgi:hypothetical protein